MTRRDSLGRSLRDVIGTKGLRARGTRTAGRTVTRQRVVAATGIMAGALAVTGPAPASDTDVTILRARTATCPTCEPFPADQGAPELVSWARRLDALLGEAALDLGLVGDVQASATVARDELGLVDAAVDRWVVSPTLTADEGGFFIRIEAVAPGSKVVLVRAATTSREALEVHAVTMLRDVVRMGKGSPARIQRERPPEPVVVEKARSPGRAVLALNGAALGGYIGFALQRAGGSSDARLTFPLIAIGTGIGLGATMLAADEWDVGVGDAWYLAAGVWWPTASALLLTGSYDEPSKNRFVYSIGASAAGLGLATFSLNFGEMSSGGAILAHSGGAYGTVVGGLTQLLYEGQLDVTPTRGMGWGAGAGVLVGGSVARLLPDPTSTRVLLVDLGVGIGGLTGAAVSSPLVFADTGEGTKSRLFLSSVGIGMLAGGATAFLLTIPEAHTSAPAKPTSMLMPTLGSIAGPVSTGIGGGVAGTW